MTLAKKQDFGINYTNTPVSLITEIARWIEALLSMSNSSTALGRFGIDYVLMGAHLTKSDDVIS